MRCHMKSCVLWGILFFFGVLYFISYTDVLITGRTGLNKSIANGLEIGYPLSSGQLASKESWLVQGGYLPLNVSYQLLAGTPSTKQRFLAVGLASVKRKKGSYLIATLYSIFYQLSPEERSSLVVVLLLADFDATWRETTVDEIKAEFTPELEQGQLLVLHVLQKWYPPLTGLKRNYNDPPDRVSFRSKQNVDYSFLIHYCAGLSQYYLQLEDDVSCARNYLSTIKQRIKEQDAVSVTWATLEFSVLGYIGKLYQSAHLPLLTRLLFIFYQEMPCDWLLTHFHQLMTQKEKILIKPSLFQHMGTFSSFQGTYNKLKDKDFEETAYSNPPANVYTDMSTYKDLLHSALVEIGHGVLTTKNGEKSCKEFQSLGTLRNGRFETQEVEKKYGSTASSCVRIQVTANQDDWVVIRKIRITTKS